MAGSVVLTSGREKPAQEDTSNCAHRLGIRCLEGSMEAMEGMELQSILSISTVGWVI